jgi:hypothetical protein
MVETVRTQPRSGIVTFAGVLAIVIGAYNAIGGIAAIAEDDRTEAAAEVLFDVDITVWGWIWLGLGIVQMIVGGLILARHASGLLLGVIWASIGAVLTVFVIFTYPIWALIVLAIQVIIIYGLLEHADEFS